MDHRPPLSSGSPMTTAAPPLVPSYQPGMQPTLGPLPPQPPASDLAGAPPREEVGAEQQAPQGAGEARDDQSIHLVKASHDYQGWIQCTPTMVGRMMGRGGQLVHAIQEQTGARVWVIVKGKQSEHGDRVMASGSKRSVEMALNLIKQIMEEGDPSAASVHRLLYEAEIASPMRAREEIDCPPRLVGRVIGRGGETITNLQIRSGARIFINQDVPENAPRKIILIGTADAVLRGKEMVREVMEYGPPEHNRRNPYLFNVSGQGGPGAGMRGGAAMAGGLGPAAAAQVPGMLPGVQMMQGGVSGMPLGYDVRQAPQMPGMAPGMVYYPMPAFAGDQRAHQGLAALGSMGQAAVSRGDGVGVGGGAPGLGVGMPRGLAAGGAPASPWPQGVVMVPGMLGGAPGSGLAPGVAQQQSPYGVSAQQLSDMMGMMTLSGYAQPGVPQHSAAPTSFGLSGAPGALGSQSERAGEHLAGVAAAPPPASLQAASEALGFSAASTAAPGASDGLRFGAPVSGSGDGASHEYSGVETTDAAASALPPLGLDDNDPAAKTRTSHA